MPNVHSYADDNHLYVSFSPADDTGQSDAIAAMEQCILVIRNWMCQNRLMLNKDKTEFLLIGTKQQLAKVNVQHIKVGNANIIPQPTVKDLGVLKSNLSVVNHSTKTSSAAFYYLYNIRRIRKYLTKEFIETLIHSFISSRLGYCNSLLYGIPACHPQKLQRVENAAAQLVYQESKFCHITPLFKSLHWLPVRYRIEFEILLVTFKAIHGFAPAYISDHISINHKGRYNLRSTS